jgi:hypothetical protein
MPIAAVRAPSTTARIPYIVLVEAHEIALLLNLLLIIVGLSACGLSVFFRKRLPKRLLLFMLVEEGNWAATSIWKETRTKMIRVRVSVRSEHEVVARRPVAKSS